MSKEKEKTLLTKCPKCGSRKFVISIFGSICGDCFYEEKGESNPTPQQGWENQGWKDKLEWQISCAVNSFIGCDKNEKDIILEEDIPNLKSNLHKLFSTLLQKEREELAGKIEKMKTMPAIKENELQGTSFTTYDMGFNKALAQVLQLIKNPKCQSLK